MFYKAGNESKAAFCCNLSVYVVLFFSKGSVCRRSTSTNIILFNFGQPSNGGHIRDESEKEENANNENYHNRDKT